MKEFLKNHGQIILLFIIWFGVIFISVSVALIVVPFTCILLLKKKRYLEVLFGLFFLIILSDSRFPRLWYAKSIKEPYFLVMALFLFYNRKLFMPFNQYIVPYIGFFIIALICTFYSPDAVLSFQKLLSYFLLFLIIPNLIAKIYTDNPRYFITSFTYFITFVLTLCILLFIPFNDFFSIDSRYFGLFGNPNSLGLFSTIFFIVISILFNIEPTLFNKRQKLFILLVIIINILLCRSRTSMITVGMFLVFSSAFKRSLISGLIAVIITFFLNVYITDIIQGLASSFNLENFFRLKDIEKGSGRLIAWMFGWEIIQKETFFLGNGFNYTNYIYDLNYDRLSLLGHQGNAHNSFITFWLETGIIGLILFLYGFFKTFISASKYCKLALPAMFALGFSMFFESWYCASLNPFTIQTVIILTIIKLPRIDQMEEKTEGELEVIS